MRFVSREFDLIDWITARQRAQGLTLVGDDLATLDAADERTFVIGADQVLDGVHFDLAFHDPFDIGRKAMNRNLSDCAALAALPTGATVTLALPRGFGIDRAKRLYQGIEHAGAALDCPILGGDTGSWSQARPGPLALSVAIIGRMAGVVPVTRAGAQVGDGIFVTGALGGSILGRHLSFVPRVREARTLVSRYHVTAMIDLSDGMSRDLTHVCRSSGVGAIIDARAVPIHDDVAQLSGKPPEEDFAWSLNHALHDGEDYELLLTSPDRIIDGALRVGTITAERDVLLRTDADIVPLRAGAWEHFF